MLKSVLYYLLFATTAVRLTDMIYLLAKESTNLPIPVLAVSAAMILMGIAMIAKQFLGTLRIKHLMGFYMVQSALVIFNLAYIAILCPLQLNLLEITLAGSFLDILLDFCVVYHCVKRMRTSFVPVQYSIQKSGIREGSLNV